MQFNPSAPLLPDLVSLHGKWYPDKPAYLDEHNSLTWSALDRGSNQVANGLRELNIGAGDSVAILMSNTVEYVEIMFGIMKIGAVVVPLNLSVSETGLLTMLRDAAARVVFFSPDQLARLEGELNALECLTDHGCFVLGPTGSPVAEDYAVWRDRQNPGKPDVQIADDSPCNLIYSSGTTGMPKGIKHLYRQRTQTFYEMALALRYHYGAVTISPVGLYSSIAWAPVFCTLMVGGTCVLRHGFEENDWIKTVEDYRVTHAMTVPLMLQKILEAPGFSQQAVASLQSVISGGSPLFEGLKRRVTEELGCTVIELYGLTEGFLTSLQPEEAKGRLTSVGKPFRGHDYILLDEKDKELDWGHTGEICARSVACMTEYHNRPDATNDAMYTDANSTQWLRTGDIGHVDEDGYLFIVDRKKDMILSGGQNIYPTDIEAVMVDHPLVSEVAVIGVPHEKWGETPLALIVPRRTASEEDAQELLQWTNQRVGKLQRLSGLELRSDLPRNPGGKVLKRELRKKYW